jgi:SAM-dependent methyltransferase
LKLYKPDRSNGFTVFDAQRYLSNFLVELQEIPFTAKERKLLLQVILGRLVNEHTRSFFFYHFGPLFVKAVSTFFCAEEMPLIVDLGCGSGSASILFGLLGARVIGIDLDPDLISACRKRQALYEAEFGPLDIQFHVADAFKFNYDEIAPVDGIYSLFAFNTMQPSRDLLARIIPALRPKGRIVISDGNMDSLYNRLFRPRLALTPREMQSALSANGCKVISLAFHCVLPPRVARIRSAFELGLKVEHMLNRGRLMRWLGVSYTIVAERQA